MINLDEELDNLESVDIVKLIPEFSSEKLCDIIICNRYLGVYKDLAVSCMIELSNRRSNGNDFDFESYIDNNYKELPKLDFTIPNFSNVIKQFRDKIS